MADETPKPTTQGDEHIYLDVIHIASRPPSERSLCSSAGDTPKKSTVENTTEKKKNNKSGTNTANFILIAMVIVLSTICCTLAALYVIERRQNSMVRSEHSNALTVPTSSPNCTKTTVSSGERIVYNKENITWGESLANTGGAEDFSLRPVFPR